VQNLAKASFSAPHAGHLHLSSCTNLLQLNAIIVLRARKAYGANPYRENLKPNWRLDRDYKQFKLINRVSI
jgi:hypothetical protein